MDSLNERRFALHCEVRQAMPDDPAVFSDVHRALDKMLVACHRMRDRVTDGSLTFDLHLMFEDKHHCCALTSPAGEPMEALAKHFKSLFNTVYTSFVEWVAERECDQGPAAKP